VVAWHRPAVPTLLGAAAAAAGIVGVASALTPAFASRYDLVQSVLPPGVPQTARVLALTFGLALVWLSRALVRRKRRAWQVALSLLAGTTLLHLLHGFGYGALAAALVQLGP
jgi:lysylphosphatidylglycerol synthetase-like protein (DUF2156 family)